MIQFVDINTGKIYDGQQPYIHWFDGQQSSGLIYVQKLCLIADSPSITVNVEDGGIFYLIDNNKLQTARDIYINNFEYKDLSALLCKSLTKLYDCVINKNGSIDLYDIHDNELYDTGDTQLLDTVLQRSGTQQLYFHMLYIAGSADNPGEYITDINIQESNGDAMVISVGFDAYDEIEDYKVNLNNMGVEIPNSVQKAIYSADVLEETIDNTLLNRKFKELVMNYMDILGNRGSYKSLKNSLDWFEYSDNITIREFWKHNCWDRVIYDDKEFTQRIHQDLNDIIISNTKTTFIGLYNVFQKISTDGLGNKIYNIINTDSSIKTLGEFTPVIENISSKWSKEEMFIKMTLLGNFFSTYFLPIHMDLIHSVVEDTVYTNSIKMLTDGLMTRCDECIDYTPIRCNIQDGDEYMLDNVTVASNGNIPLYILGDTYPDDAVGQHRFGISSAIINDEKMTLGGSDLNAKIFISNYYKGVGVEIPFIYTIPVDKDDVIFREDFVLLSGDRDQAMSTIINNNDFVFNKLYGAELQDDGQYYIEIKFNLLFTDNSDYELKYNFHCTNGKVYAGRTLFTVTDNNRAMIDIYKVVPKEIIIGQSATEKALNGYMFANYSLAPLSDINPATRYYMQFLPVVSADNTRNSVASILYNNVVVLKNYSETTSETTYNILNVLYDEFNKKGHDVDKCVEIVKKHGYNNYNQSLFDTDIDYILNLGNLIIGKITSIDLQNDFDINYRYEYVYDPDEPEKPVEINEDKVRYAILISKDFSNSTNKRTIDRRVCALNAFLSVLGEYNNIVVKNEKIFFPQNHKLIPLVNKSLDAKTITVNDITIYNNEVLCAVPNLKFLRQIDSYEWIFRNASRFDKDGKNIEYNLSNLGIREPYILPTDKDKYHSLLPGYYDVIFRYVLSNDPERVQEIELKGAFIKK